MDRSLKWRTIALIGMVLFCLATLAPSVVDRDKLPSNWFFDKLFGSQISLGLDLQGGKHIVYNIALERAVEDKASDIKRDIDARLADDKIKGSAKTPPQPVGEVFITLDD